MSDPKPIFSLETLFRFCYDLKKESKKIGLTHGAFDLFHYSHLDLLRKSAVICDFLIVGIECDEHVSRYKEYRRPVVDQKSRAAIIGELNCVDAAFIYDWELDTRAYSELYKELRTDVVTIGYEYKYEERMEEQSARGGAKLIKLQTQQLPTTTSVIENILEKYSREHFQEVDKEDL